MKKVQGKAGATLVELLVTFALLSIFMAAAAAVLTPATAIYEKMKYQSYARNVSDMIMEKVCGTVSGASGNIVVDSGGGLIGLLDDTSSPLYIQKDDNGYLQLHYRTIWTMDENGHIQDIVIWDAVDWRYDVKAYQGFKISGLSFEKAGGDNAVRVSLELKNERLDTLYHTERVVECYNLPAGQKVSTGTVELSDEDYYKAAGVTSAAAE